MFTRLLCTRAAPTLAADAILVRMPQLSPAMETASVHKWLIREGEFVEPADLVVEVETDTLLEDKSAEAVVLEVESHDEGWLAKILVGPETGPIRPGTVLAVLAEEEHQVGAIAQAADQMDLNARDGKQLRSMLWQAYLKQC
eukprot:TRINITY_DN36376_c0_g1_i2.p1 TRINITY_DN36376_c0_g1~~TRINITY_DN36376_c0_g1_i2.p1  ORF type:complete len:142 (+),score=42.95 TRINITY_DN36376_c0_g1_i2:223-648(+)